MRTEQRSAGLGHHHLTLVAGIPSEEAGLRATCSKFILPTELCASLCWHLACHGGAQATPPSTWARSGSAALMGTSLSPTSAYWCFQEHLPVRCPLIPHFFLVPLLSHQLLPIPQLLPTPQLLHAALSLSAPEFGLPASRTVKTVSLPTDP